MIREAATAIFDSVMITKEPNRGEQPPSSSCCCCHCVLACQTEYDRSVIMVPIFLNYFLHVSFFWDRKSCYRKYRLIFILPFSSSRHLKTSALNPPVCDSSPPAVAFLKATRCNMGVYSRMKAILGKCHLRPLNLFTPFDFYFN